MEGKEEKNDDFEIWLFLGYEVVLVNKAANEPNQDILLDKTVLLVPDEEIMQKI